MGTPGGLLAAAAGIVMLWAGITGKDAWKLVREVATGDKKLPRARSDPPVKLAEPKPGPAPNPGANPANAGLPAGS